MRSIAHLCLLVIAATWTLGALAYYRPRRRCACGRLAPTDGLEERPYAVADLPASADPESEDGPVSLRPAVLDGMGVGR